MASRRQLEPPGRDTLTVPGQWTHLCVKPSQGVAGLRSAQMQLEEGPPNGPVRPPPRRLQKCVGSQNEPMVGQAWPGLQAQRLHSATPAGASATSRVTCPRQALGHRPCGRTLHLLWKRSFFSPAQAPRACVAACACAVRRDLWPSGPASLPSSCVLLSPTSWFCGFETAAPTLLGRIRRSLLLQMCRVKTKWS